MEKIDFKELQNMWFDYNRYRNVDLGDKIDAIIDQLAKNDNYVYKPEKQLIDEFAIAVLSGMLSNPDILDAELIHGHPVCNAYETAKMMMEIRKKYL